jgi:hypothetical protein
MRCPPGRVKRTVALVTSQPVIRTMDESDPEVISGAFTAIGWRKPPTLFQRYLAEQEDGRLLAFVAANTRLGCLCGCRGQSWLDR